MFSVSDATATCSTKYEFLDDVSGGGRFALAGRTRRRQVPSQWRRNSWAVFNTSAAAPVRSEPRLARAWGRAGLERVERPGTSPASNHATTPRRRSRQATAACWPRVDRVASLFAVNDATAAATNSSSGNDVNGGGHFARKRRGPGPPASRSRSRLPSGRHEYVGGAANATDVSGRVPGTAWRGAAGRPGT